MCREVQRTVPTALVKRAETDTTWMSITGAPTLGECITIEGGSMGPFTRAWNPKQTQHEGAVGAHRQGRGSGGLWILRTQVWEETGQRVRR